MSRSHGKRKLAVAQAQFISAAASTKSRRRNARLCAEKFPSARLCWSRNKVCSMKRARRVVSTRSGRTAMFHSTAASDMSDQIESQIERFAPGFRDCILARHKMSAADLGRSNPNLAGGDINGGAANLMQLIARPFLSPTPYRTPLPGVYLCSASTPPGAVFTACAVITRRAQPCAIIFGKR